MSKLKSATKLLRYIAVNGVFAVSWYYGFFASVPSEGFANVALFIAWLTGIMGCVILLGLTLDSGDDTKGELIETIARMDPSVVPFWLDATFDICITIAIIWTGHYVLAFFYIISIYAGKAVRDTPKNVMLRNLKGNFS